MLNDYRCRKCLLIAEHWASFKTIPSKCCKGFVAEKILSGGKFSLPGTDTGFPTAADKWARRHRKANHPNLKKLGIPC